MSQMLPDYSKQLDEIVKALNRPATPAWLIAAFSAVLGLIGGFIGQPLQMFVTDAYRRYKMRRVIYLDLADMFLSVDSIVSFNEFSDDHQRWHWQEDQLRTNLSFRGEKYCLDNQEIYMQLPERVAAETLYPRFHRILDEEHSMHVNTGLALRMFANMVHDGYLRQKYMQRFFSRKHAATLLRKIEHYQRQDDELRERMNLSHRLNDMDES